MFNFDIFTGKMFHRKPNIHIRLAGNGDIFELLQLIKGCRSEFGMPVDLKKKDQDLLNITHYYKNGLFLVAEEDGKIVACGSMFHDTTGNSHLSKLLVSKKYRKLGIGTEILNMLIQHAKQKGTQQLFASFSKDMRSAGKFLHAFNFEEVQTAMPETKHRIKKFTLDFRN